MENEISSERAKGNPPCGMKKAFREMFEDDDGLISSKRVVGILCCLSGIVGIFSLMIADIGFHYVANRLTFESIDSLFWSAFAFLGVNAVTQGIQAWRGTGRPATENFNKDEK